MSFSFKIVLSIFAIGFLSCSKDDSSITPSQTLNNKFTINSNVDFLTKSCYLEIDEDDDDGNSIPDNYSLWLINGEMLDNDSKVNGSEGEYLFSVGQTYLTSIHIESSNNPILINNILNLGQVYNCSYETAYNLTVPSLANPYVLNGIEYGDGKDGSAISHKQENGTITFTNYTVDIQNRTGTLDFDYSFVDQNNIPVTGHFDGQILVIFD